ncbi:hypothetical protein BJ508DRAFT_379963 [Ascobolus immersus RN42]|uniref:Uncharacterized protein n=1 Tax=Ascobolus immersus RN42 TaxID=1160509 RepID=A0A3N4HNZ1_ASCIM|nr:hypothetical protein BJ508DRAFT_379963 [Ascobolus immersus RN42]
MLPSTGTDLCSSSFGSSEPHPNPTNTQQPPISVVMPSDTPRTTTGGRTKYRGSASRLRNPTPPPQPPTLKQQDKHVVRSMNSMVPLYWPTTPRVIDVHAESTNSRNPYEEPILRLTTEDGSIFEFHDPDRYDEDGMPVPYGPFLRQVFPDGSTPPGPWVQAATPTPEQLAAQTREWVAETEEQRRRARLAEEEKKRTEVPEEPRLPERFQWMLARGSSLRPEEYRHVVGLWFSVGNPQLVTEEQRRAFWEKWDAHVKAVDRTIVESTILEDIEAASRWWLLLFADCWFWRLILVAYPRSRNDILLFTFSRMLVLLQLSLCASLQGFDSHASDPPITYRERARASDFIIDHS